jgi:hypothetical protein
LEDLRRLRVCQRVVVAAAGQQCDVGLGFRPFVEEHGVLDGHHSLVADSVDE